MSVYLGTNLRDAKGFRILLLALSIVMIAGCSSNQESPLIFGQSDSYGLSFNAGSVETGASLNVGYTGRNVAIIPVTYRRTDNLRCRVEAVAGGFRDALSVFGQFEAATEQDKDKNGDLVTRKVSTSLGKFFATGGAARNISDGFAAKLGFVGPDDKPPHGVADTPPPRRPILAKPNCFE